MREILFRGKTPTQDEHFDDGEWVQGFYTCFNGKEHRIYSGYAETDCGDYYPAWCNVRPETVGRFTELTDKNGNKIFENDIVSHFINYLGQRVHASVEYDNELASWMCNYTFENKKGSAFLCDWVDGNGAEIIGNEWDNPELLKGGEADAQN